MMGATMPSNELAEFDDVFSPGRSFYRRAVHFFSYHLILTRKRSTTTRVAGLKLNVPPTVFHPKIFLTSAFFARFLQSLDLSGKAVVEVGCGSGILSLSAAKAGARSVTALDINPAAVEAANSNAIANGLPQVEALHSDLFSGLPAADRFDVIICSPPSFSGEPRDDADRAWHAGPGYRDIHGLFSQAAERLKPDGKMYLLISSDTNRGLVDYLVDAAGFICKEIASRSIFVESFHIFELTRPAETSETRPLHGSATLAPPL
jgi:release factor glutamine methyltransferase